MDDIRTLHELCESIARELEDVNEKIRQNGGSMTAGDLELVDKLTHAQKSIKTTIAMMESDGYSNHYPYYGANYARNRYSRKRGRYSYSDSMDSLLDEMRSLMGDLPEEKRREVEKFIDKMER